MNANDGVHYNRKHKDELFRKLFGENKENALSLYNAVRGTQYKNADDLKFTTLDDVVFMKMKNDVSFLFDRYLNLYEHQSTLSPNVPLRGFLYFADSYRQLLPEDERLYGSRLVEIPAPQYIVFYNGVERIEGGRKILRLSDAFRPFGVSEGFEWTATVLDINYGANPEILEKCRVLSDYSLFISKIREFCRQAEAERISKDETLGYAINRAVDYCIENDVLCEFLEKHRKEVVNMCLTEFNEERYGRIMHEEGREEGRLEGVDAMIRLGEIRGSSAAQIQEDISLGLRISLEEARRLYDRCMDSRSILV